MKKIAFVVGADYQNNKIFDLSNKTLNRDNCLYPYFLLKKEFEKRGFDLITSDLVDEKDALEFVIYNEMPKPFQLLKNKCKKSFLMLFESEIIRNDNWDTSKHQQFDKIFTWHDDYVDGKKFVKFNFPNELRTTPVGLVNRTKFCTLISGNKTNFHSKELYSERLKTIKWFEKHHPDQFDYYGVGWDYKLDLKWQKLFRKLSLTNFMPKNNSLSYKGRVEEKFKTLKEYKFAICYENAKDINGYITEKIFDCFFSGTIPVYWGPQNIENYIPKNCFIDRNLFKSTEELYSYLKKMNDDQILEYQKNILAFLTSEKMTPFTNEFFAANVVKVVLDE